MISTPDPTPPPAPTLDNPAAIAEALGIDPADFPDISEAEFTRRYNAILRITKLKALVTISELCDPAIASPPAKAHDPGNALTAAQAWDARLREARAAKPPADPDRLRRIIQDRSLRLRAAAIALKAAFIKPAAEPGNHPPTAADRGNDTATRNADNTTADTNPCAKTRDTAAANTNADATAANTASPTAHAKRALFPQHRTPANPTSPAAHRDGAPPPIPETPPRAHSAPIPC
ncbi:MAG TPA: hypothetical protein VEB22_06000 [Phycisphaerales bacterium]|nr:hypothetical protein [Phycisphaerales bacterium]